MNSHGAGAQGLEIEGVGGALAPGMTRRAIVGGGLLAGAALLLTGCGTRRATASLPSPRWPGAAPGPVVMPPVVPGPTPAPVQIAGDIAILPRSAWTRAGVARSREINPMGGISRLTVHHDGMPPATLRTTTDVASRIEQIRTSHVYSRGWADIGYHYVVDPTGRVWEARSIANQGAHVKDQNEHNLGILVLGNFERQSPTPAALAALDKLLAMQMARYRVPVTRVKTHREIAQTECPGRNLQSYMVRTRASGGGLALAMTGSRSQG